MYKKIFSWVSYILQRAVTDMGKQVWVKYRVSGPSKTPSENTHISDKTIYWHICIDRVFLKQITKCSWLKSFYRSNTFRIVNMVFEVDKCHDWSNSLTRWVRANTLFSRRNQPSTHASHIPAIWPNVSGISKKWSLAVPRFRSSYHLAGHHCACTHKKLKPSGCTPSK